MVVRQIKWMGVEQLFKMKSIAAVMKNYTINKNDIVNKNDTVNDTVN